MDPEEIALRREELALQREELANQRRDRWTSATVAALAAILGVAATTWVAQKAMNQTVEVSQSQMKQGERQFEQATGLAIYGNIIDGLASDSNAVQESSLRRLVRYVGDADNFPGDSDGQKEAITDTDQAVTAYIHSTAGHETDGQMSDYDDRIPDMALRAVTQLKALLRLDHNGGTSVDLSAVDLHGVPMTDLIVTGPTIFKEVDLRLASLVRSDFNAASDKVDLSFSSLICANLRDARLGMANLNSADLTGADLRGTDMSKVRNLTSEQVRHVRINRNTRWPQGFSYVPTLSSPRFGGASQT